MQLDAEQFRQLAEAGHTRIPVVREVFSDLDTPLSVYLKLADGPHTYLFESVEGGERFGRYSIIGLPARRIYAFAGHTLFVTEDGELVESRVVEDPFAEVERLRDIWPAQQEIQAVVTRNVDSNMFRTSYAGVFEGDENWRMVPTPEGRIYAWEASSTYVRNPPYFDGMSRLPEPPTDITGARVLAVLGVQLWKLAPRLRPALTVGS